MRITGINLNATAGMCPEQGGIAIGGERRGALVGRDVYVMPMKRQSIAAVSNDGCRQPSPVQLGKETSMRTTDRQRKRPLTAIALAVGLAVAVLGILPTPAGAAELDVATVNKMDQAAFTEALGGIFENSPWVAAKAWEARPFSSVDDLHQKMVVVVKYANIDQELALLRSHPDLAGKEAQAGTMTSSSVAEQASAGLNALSKEEVATLAAYNAEYKKKFGFPFMIAVRNHTKLGIFQLFKQRLNNDTVTELGNALQQVYNITRIRLEKKFGA